MSGANTPRSKKRLRQALVDLMKGHQSGKQKLAPTVLLQVIDRIGVLDSLFVPEILIRRPSNQLGRPPLPRNEEPDEDAEVKKLRDEIVKRRGDGDSHSN